MEEKPSCISKLITVYGCEGGGELADPNLPSREKNVLFTMSTLKDLLNSSPL